MAVKMTIEQLEKLLSYAKNRAEFGSMKSHSVIIKENTGGNGSIQFEQPCEYPDCNSIYHRF